MVAEQHDARSWLTLGADTSGRGKKGNTMLVLSRKIGQKIKLSNGVEITVTMVRGRSVQIGVKAPDDVKILRAEIPDDPTKQGPSNCNVDGVGPESMPTSGLPIA